MVAHAGDLRAQHLPGNDAHESLPPVAQEGYGASKRPLDWLTRGLAAEIAPDIRVDVVAERFGLTEDLDPHDPHYEKRKRIAVQRFCGFDYVTLLA